MKFNNVKILTVLRQVKKKKKKKTFLMFLCLRTVYYRTRHSKKHGQFTVTVSLVYTISLFNI